jgi:hypothetical protein
MATEKEMNQVEFEKIAKELSAYAEVIRSRQDQKQQTINDFGKERKRYQSGKISKQTLSSSVPRVRKELQRINRDIRKNINNLNRVAVRTKSFAQRQAPKNFKVSLSGISSSGTKKVHHHHTTTHKKKR